MDIDDNYGESLLDLAVYRSAKITKMLVTETNVNNIDRKPLHLATQEGNIKLVTFLIERRAALMNTYDK